MMMKNEPAFSPMYGLRRIDAGNVYCFRRCGAIETAEYSPRSGGPMVDYSRGAEALRVAAAAGVSDEMLAKLEESGPSLVGN